MKKKLYFLFVLWIVCIFFPVGDLLAQTQIGSDIDGQAANDQAGWSVSLSSDGSVVAIGAPGHDGSKGTVQVLYNPAPQQAPIPTMSQWGLLIFGLLIMNMSVVFVQRKELN